MARELRESGSREPRDGVCVVWVGNINYDVTEMMLKEHFSKCGTVKSFRIVHDRETGKPKGFGFCEVILQ